MESRSGAGETTGAFSIDADGAPGFATGGCADATIAVRLRSTRRPITTPTDNTSVAATAAPIHTGTLKPRRVGVTGSALAARLVARAAWIRSHISSRGTELGA